MKVNRKETELLDYIIDMKKTVKEYEGIYRHKIKGNKRYKFAMDDVRQDRTPMVETVVSKLLKKSNLDRIGMSHVDYDIGNEDNTDYSICEWFLKENEEYINMEEIIKYGNIELNLDKMEENTVIELKKLVDNLAYAINLKNTGQYFATVAAIDLIFLNEDRNLTNMGIIYNKEINEVRWAPLFDHSECLDSLGLINEVDINNKEELRNTQTYQSVYLPPFDLDQVHLYKSLSHLYGDTLEIGLTEEDINKIFNDFEVELYGKHTYLGNEIKYTKNLTKELMGIYKEIKEDSERPNREMNNRNEEVSDNLTWDL